VARKPRFNLSGIPQHVIQRGNNREPCFFAEQDYRRYLADLKEALRGNDCRLHAYVLMTNHVHLLVTPMREHGVSHLMQDLGRKYVRYVNHCYRRTGTLWEGRYKASLIDSEAYLLTCMRYVELNPVRAQMLTHPGEYPWSSFPHNAHGRPDPLLTVHPVYQQLGADAQSRQYAYRELFSHHMDHSIVHEIRETLNQELVLGRDDFKDRIEQMTTRQSRPGQSGRPRRETLEETAGDYYIM
jgi:putative transposase